MGEEFNIRTDHIQEVERYGNSVSIIYKDGYRSTWNATNEYQIAKINLLEIILRGIAAGYVQGRNELYDEGRIITEDVKRKLEEYELIMDECNPEYGREYHEIRI